MPAPALHFLLAGRVYEAWERTPVRAPFHPGPEARNAFLHGSIGPDMGYFPGGDSLLAELAHYARTGAFCRALVDEARTDVERAFAWGWVTHVLADVAIHPLVNEACGELLAGTRVPLWGDAVTEAHLRVETGLDAAFHAREPQLRRLRTLPAMDASAFGAMHRAYGRTFGAAPPMDWLLRSHRQVTRLLGPSAHVRGLAAWAVAEEGWLSGRLARAGFQGAALLSAPGSHARGLLSPVRPAAWLMEEVDGIAAGFADWFDSHYVTDLRFLRDYCLDTGEPRDDDSPAAMQAITALHARGISASFTATRRAA
ncbi:zinc dependent phospholipase C family protein [Longimicrobium terrae]|uniref:Phospholipase C/D domain-containing protein n=1 Tax=Longimicrobium terrae TaxID=1639882 RepID=A0A841GWM3_9BACT|nr:zinc dependent phospholipase C family protein [Longimicrobium terrae]MBB4635211.1 hypothetical protein [Longimicrobium terrae]MBB6069605.1 hypothetical protein [Longimicrobium terrae]NNC31593.1 zinc dependent phospholipase C family protein [Longimicrobium terrae]